MGKRNDDGIDPKRKMQRVVVSPCAYKSNKPESATNPTKYVIDFAMFVAESCPEWEAVEFWQFTEDRSTLFASERSAH